MPKDSARRGPAAPNNPYPTNATTSIDVNAISKAVFESVMAALRGNQDVANQESSEDEDTGMPISFNSANNSISTLSSNSGSLEGYFHTSVAAHRANILNAEGKLKELETYLVKFKANKNIDGLDATYKLISKVMAKKTHAEVAIQSETKQFEILERARAEEEARIESIRKQKEKEAKGKGKTQVQMKDEEDEDFARLDAFMRAHPDKEANADSEYDNEFAELDDLLLADTLDQADARTPSLQPVAPSPPPMKKEKLSMIDRPMPSGFTVTLRRPPINPTTHAFVNPNSVASSSKPRSHSVPAFDNSAPLLAPTLVGSLEELDETASPSADDAEPKPKSRAVVPRKQKKQIEPTRTSARKNAGPNGSYAESDDDET